MVHILLLNSSGRAICNTDIISHLFTQLTERPTLEEFIKKKNRAITKTNKLNQAGEILDCEKQMVKLDLFSLVTK